jgi:hypothetical protein
MPLLTEEELAAYPDLPAAALVRDHVARYWDLMALGRDAPAAVIGDALLRDRPGFAVDFVTRLAPSMTGEASLYRVTATNDPAGATWVPA